MQVLSIVMLRYGFLTSLPASCQKWTFLTPKAVDSGRKSECFSFFVGEISPVGMMHTHPCWRRGHIYGGLAKRWSLQPFPFPSSKRLKGVEYSKEEERAVQRERAPESLQTVPFDSSVDLWGNSWKLWKELLEEFKEDSPQHSQGARNSYYSHQPE